MNNIKKLLYILGPSQKSALLILLIYLFFGMLFEMLGLGIFIPAIFMLFSDKFNLNSLVSNSIISRLNFSKTQIQLIIILILILFQFIKFVYMSIVTYKQQKFISNLSKDLSEKLLKGYLESSYSFHLNHNSSNLINIIQGETSHFIAVAQSFFLLILEAFTIIGLVAILFYVQFIGTVLIILILSISILVYQRVTSKRLSSYGKMRTESLHNSIKNLSNILGSIKEIKTSNKESFFLNKYKNYNDVTANALCKKETLQNLPKYYLEFVSFSSLAILLLVLILQKADIKILLPTLAFFAGAAFRILPSINRIINAFQLVKFSTPTINKIYSEFIDFEDNVQEEFICEFHFNNKIEIKNLNFKYPNTEKTIFQDANLIILKNQCIGIVGQSGEGKTTLVNLILGLLITKPNVIMIDEKDLYNNRLGWIKNIGYVPQTIYLMDDTIANNIAFGIRPEDIDLDKLEQSCKEAQIFEYINSLPLKFNTEIGERGMNISGGQLQRIGIARALYHNPKVLIFDEATSSLDSKTEDEFIKCVNSLKKDKTIIFITHRNSTLYICDRVVKLHNGKFQEKN